MPCLSPGETGGLLLGFLWGLCFSVCISIRPLESGRCLCCVTQPGSEGSLGRPKGFPARAASRGRGEDFSLYGVPMGHLASPSLLTPGETEAWRELDTCQCHWAWLPFPFLFTSLLRGACTGQPDGGLWMSHPLSRPIFSSPVFLCMIFLPEFQTVEPTSLALLLGAGNLVVLGS